MALKKTTGLNKGNKGLKVSGKGLINKSSGLKNSGKGLSKSGMGLKSSQNTRLKNKPINFRHVLKDFTEQDKNKITDLYNSGWAIDQLASKYNCNTKLINSLLTCIGIKRRSAIDNFKLAINKRDWRNARLYALQIFSEYVKLIANNRCEICGKPGTDAHHWFYPKSNNSMTDIDPLNGICLCRNCHTRAHNNYNGFREIISGLPKYKMANKYLPELYSKTIDFEYVNNLVELNRKRIQEIKAIYKRNKKE